MMISFRELERLTLQQQVRHACTLGRNRPPWCNNNSSVLAVAYNPVS